MTTSTQDIDARARQMSDDEREAFLESRGWQFMAIGWWPPGGTEELSPDGMVVYTNRTGGGMYSRSAAIRDALAREDVDALPNKLGRYWHGTEPDDAFGDRW
ncbi:hypothetical protein ACRU3B_10710 [Mycobacterium colombiense]